MRLTMKFAHFNQRFARISQHKARSGKAYQTVESHLETLLLASSPAKNSPRLKSTTISAVGRK